MGSPFVPVIDIKTYKNQTKGLNQKSLAHIGGVFAVVDSTTLDEAFIYLQETIGLFSTFFDVTALDSPAEVVSLLDSGASSVILTPSQLERVKDFENVDINRTVLRVSEKEKDGISNLIKQAPVSVFWNQAQDLDLVEACLKEYGHDRSPIYISFAEPTAELASRTWNSNAVPVIPATLLTVDPHTDSSLIKASDLLCVKATSDRADGLFTTLVTDERGIALGLVYSSRESVAESLRTGTGVYHSRKRGLWYKGESSGDTQELVRIELDCDSDCLRFVVRQKGRGFCHLGTATCFGPYSGLSRLQKTLLNRKASAPKDSYTARLFNDPQLLKAKILEEANELCDATSKENVAFEAADLFYFAMTKCIAAGVGLEDVERNLDAKSVKVKRRKGDAKPQWLPQSGVMNGNPSSKGSDKPMVEQSPVSKPMTSGDETIQQSQRISMKRYTTADLTTKSVENVLQRPSQSTTERVMSIVQPIIQQVREKGDAALLEYTHKFDKATGLTESVLKAPFPRHLMQLPPQVTEAIDTSFANVYRFHSAQKEEKPLVVETMPGVVCSRFCRPIESVGLYIPGGTAVLPSSALMLGVPAMVAGCRRIVFASPPRSDGSITPEIVYVADKVGAESIVLAGGAQAVAALAYGTESVGKVDKILGPGNQFVTAAKMIVSNDTSASVSIDMPAGPSEVLVVADSTAAPAFVAADLLSQAEHGVDSQVILIAVDLTDTQLAAIEDELHSQASALPRVDIVKGAIEHSVTLVVKDIQEAMALSNLYAPEHLILQVQEAEKVIDMVENAGSVFIGPWTPESVGDYSAGVNHSLPTCGYARQYSGVNLGSYVKHITSSQLSASGLRDIGPTVMELANVEKLEAHARAVKIRLQHMNERSQ